MTFNTDTEGVCIKQVMLFKSKVHLLLKQNTEETKYCKCSIKPSLGGVFTAVFQTHLRGGLIETWGRSYLRGGGVLLVFILANNLVSVLHKEVECKIKKLKYKKLEVIQPRIKNKSELPAGGYCILDQWTQSFTVAIDFWPSWLINAVYHLSVNNNKWERMRGLKRGGLLTFFPWKGRAYWKGGLFLTGRHSRWFGGFALRISYCAQQDGCRQKDHPK